MEIFSYKWHTISFHLVVLWRYSIYYLFYNSSNLQHCFEIRHIHQIHGAVIRGWRCEKNGEMLPGEHFHYRIQASSDKDREEWMEKIRTSILKSIPGDDSKGLTI